MPKGDDTRTRVLQEAAAEASLVGITGLTIGSLADRTGMSKSGLFRHFGSKQQLQVDTLKAGVDRFTEIVVKPALHEARGVPRVRSLFEGWLNWATGEGLPGGCLFVAASVEMDDQAGPVRDYVVATQRGWLGLIARTAQLGIEADDFRDDLDPEQFAHEFNSILLGLHQSARLLRDKRAPDRARTHFERLLEDARK